MSPRMRGAPALNPISPSCSMDMLSGCSSNRAILKPAKTLTVWMAQNTAREVNRDGNYDLCVCVRVHVMTRGQPLGSLLRDPRVSH